MTNVDPALDLRRSRHDPVPEHLAEIERTWMSPPGFFGWFTHVNHTSIGLRFLITSLVFFMLAGLPGVEMRLQLLRGGGSSDALGRSSSGSCPARGRRSYEHARDRNGGRCRRFRTAAPHAAHAPALVGVLCAVVVRLAMSDDANDQDGEHIRAHQEGAEALTPWLGWILASAAWALHQGIGCAMVPWLCSTGRTCHIMR